MDFPWILLLTLKLLHIHRRVDSFPLIVSPLRDFSERVDYLPHTVIHTNPLTMNTKTNNTLKTIRYYFEAFISGMASLR